MNLTDSKLEKELLENGLNLTQVSDKYNVDMSTLSQKKSELNIEKLNKVNNLASGQYVWISKELEQLGYNSDADIFVDTSVEDGRIVIDLYDIKWKKTEVEN
jgi:hypothetical protein